MPVGMGNEADSAIAHPGPPATEPHCAVEDGPVEDGCITCGDVALELEVVAVDAGRGLALCRDDRDRRETVETALVEPVEPGDRLLVHAGTAIARTASEGEAQNPASPPSGTPERVSHAPRMPGREAEDMRDVSGDPPFPASPQGEARGDAVGEGSP